VPTTYSTYEAKARLSEILRRVREGQTIRISHRGQEVAEIRPLVREESTEEAVRHLEDRGLLQGGRDRQGALAAVGRRQGALRRFLEDRQ
jgi:prevent-host-death family protein